MTLEQEYIEAFHTCYPEKEVKIRYRRKFNLYLVFIDGDSGNRGISQSEMREAIRGFKAGK